MKGNQKKTVLKRAVWGILAVFLVTGIFAPGNAAAAKKKVVKTKKPVVAAKRAYNGVATATLLSVMSKQAEAMSGDVEKALDANADPNVKDAKGNTALLLASIANDTGSVKALVAKGAVVNVTDALKRTPLMYAARNGNPIMTRTLLAWKANVKAADSENRTVLMFGCDHTSKVNQDTIDTVKALLAAKPDVAARDNKNRDALYYAVNSGNAVMVAALLAAGAQATVQYADGQTPLHLAVLCDQNEDCYAIIKSLMKAGNDPNAVDAAGNTPLMVACRAGRVGSAKTLLEQKVDLNKRNLRNETALELAYQSNTLELIMLLPQLGAQR